LYRLHGTARLRFDAAEPTHTDQQATCAFVQQSGRPVVYLDRPVSRWRRREGRVHMSMDHLKRARDDLNTISKVCAAGGIAPDWRKVRAALLLRTLFHANGNMRAAWPVLREIGWSPRGVSWPWIGKLIFENVAYGRPFAIYGT